MSALADWLTVRGATDWACFDGSVAEGESEDGHKRFIETLVSERSEERAEKLLDALTHVRSDAHGTAPLDFAMMQRWAGGAPFRTTDAFAKAGAERYESVELSAFEDALADADTSEPTIIRAARLYLDVCFFHPFNDGNGRLACLALDFVLTRARLRITDMRPIAMLPRWAADKRGPDALVGLLRAIVRFERLKDGLAIRDGGETP